MPLRELSAQERKNVERHEASGLLKIDTDLPVIEDFGFTITPYTLDLDDGHHQIEKVQHPSRGTRWYEVE
jgi:hypothetical protein